jgi:hypothetical protein
MTCESDKDFLHELPRKEAEAVRKKKRKKRKKKSTGAPQNVPKAKSLKSTFISSKKHKGKFYRKSNMKIALKRYEDSFEVFPSIYIFWLIDRGIVFGWMFWCIEIRSKKQKKS